MDSNYFNTPVEHTEIYYGHDEEPPLIVPVKDRQLECKWALVRRQYLIGPSLVSA
jgi:hypothetical protein